MGIPCSRCCLKERELSTRNEDGGFQTRPPTQHSPRKRSERCSTISVDGNVYTIKLNDEGRNIVFINNANPERTNSLRVATRRSIADGIFTCGYTTASFGLFMERQGYVFPPGNFVDCRNTPLRDHVIELHALKRWSHSICQIRFGTATATGFRVGSRYIMTAFHVVKKIVSEFSTRRKIDYAVLAHRNVYCLFDYFEENKMENVQKYYFEAGLPFSNEETDTAVLKLAENQERFPLQFQDFFFPNLKGKFTFLGHVGSAMEYNMVDMIIDKDNERTREDIRAVKDYNVGLTQESYDFPPDNVLTNDYRILFHCKFGKGASGSPGILVQKNGRVEVVTMLLCGYPNWYYDENVDRNLLQRWPKEYCIEQGANMVSVENFMLRDKPNLHKEIFGRHNLPNPHL